MCFRWYSFPEQVKVLTISVRETAPCQSPRKPQLELMNSVMEIIYLYIYIDLYNSLKKFKVLLEGN